MGDVRRCVRALYRTIHDPQPIGQFALSRSDEATARAVLWADAGLKEEPLPCPITLSSTIRYAVLPIYLTIRRRRRGGSLRSCGRQVVQHDCSIFVKDRSDQASLEPLLATDGILARIYLTPLKLAASAPAI